MSIKLFIIGAGSVGVHIAANFDSYGSDKYELSGFLDDDASLKGKTCFGCPVIGDSNMALHFKNAAIVLGVAFPMVKKRIFEKVGSNNSLYFPSLVHEKAWVSEGVKIGMGTIIYPGNCINYGSEIGNFSVLNMNCALGHHTIVGDFSSLAPGVCTGGHTSIGDFVEMGIGSATIQNMKIGTHAIVGGQAFVNKNVEKGSTVIGVPAKEIKRISF